MKTNLVVYSLLLVRLKPTHRKWLEKKSLRIKNRKKISENKNGDELDKDVEFLMELEYRGQLSFEDIDLLIQYVDSRLASKVLRQDLASERRSPSHRSFCLRTATKEKKQQQ